MTLLLIQVRDDDDPMKAQESNCFVNCLNLEKTQIRVFDLTRGRVVPEQMLEACSGVIIGGSGRYSVADRGEWWEAAATTLRLLCDRNLPVFGSCWGFQAIAQALGGEVVTDNSRAEVGSIYISLTADGRQDPVFGAGPAQFPAQAGHQDIVERLPPGAICLASSPLVQNQALKLPDKPVYGTQFHPELTRDALLERIRAYPEYVERIAGMSIDEFAEQCQETPDATDLLRRFVDHYCG